jgi:hypothetical protein
MSAAGNRPDRLFPAGRWSRDSGKVRPSWDRVNKPSGGPLNAPSSSTVKTGDYQVAQYKAGQAADKAFPGKDKPSEDLTYHFSRWDARFGFRGIQIWQFFSENLQSQFAHIIGGDNARYAAKIAEEKRTAAAALQADSQMAAAERLGGQGQSPFVRNDPGTLAARRCIESGRSETECLGEGLKTGFNDMFGGAVSGLLGKDAPALGASSVPAGLRMSGTYGEGGFSVMFNDEVATVQCGALVPQGLAYDVERAANQILIKIPIDPKPVVVTLRPDGKLAGPGPVQVAGRVVVGTRGGGSSSPGYEEQTQTTTQERQIDAADVRNYNSDAVHQNGMEYSVSDQVTTTTYVPTAPTYHPPTVITSPKTERCTAAVLPGTPLVTLSAGLSSLLNPSSGKQAPPQPMGLRMHGTYAAQGGLSIEFRSDTATVECGEAHVAETYAVQSAGRETLITIQNGGVPFVLQLQSNGTLLDREW